MKTQFSKIVEMLIFIALPCISEAQIPRTLSYQGVLSDSTGLPKSDGPYTFTFSLYDTSVQGAPIWTETKTLDVKRGLFSTVLGDEIPFGIAVKFDRPYWLGLQVEAEPELFPRIPLTSVGYSFNSEKVVGLKWKVFPGTSHSSGTTQITHGLTASMITGVIASFYNGSEYVPQIYDVGSPTIIRITSTIISISNYPSSYHDNPYLLTVFYIE